MKKILFALAAFFGCITVSQAQTSFIATLQHESEFTHYYGAGALKSAYSAAAEGDIITLSPGTFTWSGTLDKGITLRGAGVESSEKTFVSGDITFASTSEAREITVEGIRFSNNVYILNDASGSGQGTIKFIKNIINSQQSTNAGTYSSDKGPAVRLYNNAIYDLYFNGNTHPDFLFYNCYVVNPRSSSSNFSETTTAFVNCVIRWNTSGRSNYAHYLNFYNCIFNWTYGSYGGDDINYLLPNTATCYNCLSINKSKLFSNLVSGGNNSVTTKASDVFSTYRAGHIEGENFALTETAKATYIGTDGTQIGMQGGNYPYNTTVQYPVITTFNSDPQTDKTGSLNIEVKVDGK